MDKRPEYFDRYETIAFERTENGVLTVRFHTNGGCVVYASTNHRDWVGAFLDISADRDNKVVIITGTGDVRGAELAFKYGRSYRGHSSCSCYIRGGA